MTIPILIFKGFLYLTILFLSLPLNLKTPEKNITRKKSPGYPGVM